MKKLCLILAGILFSVNAFAAVATVTQTEYGYAITGGTSATLVPQDTWATSTAYVVGNIVSQSGHVYRCQVAHTSGTFATDLTNLKWLKIGEATIYLYMATYNPAAAATDTAAFTSLGLDNSSDISAFTLTQYNPTLPLQHPQTFGTPLKLLKVTLTATSDVVNLYVYKDNFTGQESGEHKLK